MEFATQGVVTIDAVMIVAHEFCSVWLRHSGLNLQHSARTLEKIRLIGNGARRNSLLQMLQNQRYSLNEY